jgi:pimeloyl-ACP methyl ester carboxylesterase
LGIQRAAVIGHSWGASVALSVAVLHPDRVSALALIDGGVAGGPRFPDMTWEQFKDRLSPRDIYGPRERYLGSLQRQFAHCWTDQLEHIVMSMVQVEADGSVQERLKPENYEQVLWAMWSDQPSLKLSQVRCPTLLVTAERRRQDGNEEFLRRRKEQVSAAKLPFQTAVLFGYQTQVMTLTMKSQRNWPKRWEGS